MPELALVAQWLLALVLVVSGVAKLVDRPGTAEAFADFGVPSRLRWAAPLLPIVELAVAFALVVPSTARVGAVGALVLLAVFSAAIAVNLVRGRRPDCNCFGRLGGGPIGKKTLVRNGVLMLLAAAATYPRASAPGELVDRVSAPAAWALAGALAMTAVIAGLTWLVIQLWMQQGRLLLRIDALESAIGDPAHAHRPPVAPPTGPPAGTAAPDVDGTDSDGQEASLSDHWRAATETLVVFGDPDCSACTALYPRLAKWQLGARRSRRVVVVTRDGGSLPHEELHVFIERDRSASAAYGVRGTPSALIVDAAGNVEAPLAEGAEAIRALLARSDGSGAGDKTVPVRLSPRLAKAGQSVPELDLQRVPPAIERSGGPDARPELLVFWNEGCTHCRGMVDALLERSLQLGSGAFDLTFVVAASDQAQTVTARFGGAGALIDTDMRLSMALGVPGTPSGALVGVDRTLVAELGVGPGAVLALFDQAATPSGAEVHRAL